MDATITDADLVEDEDDWTEEELALLHEAGEACLLPADDLSEEEAQRLRAKADADFAAGRYITNDQMRDWLKTWGKGPPQPPPMPWLK